MDLIKHTDVKHPDKLPLQMALAQMEAIADFLNETKRAMEQVSIVQYLSRRVSGLPFKLKDSKRWLIRQDVVTRLMYAKSKNAIVRKKRIFWLFNDVIICVSNRSLTMESNVASSDFKLSEDSHYTCRWFCPLDRFQVLTDPDYVTDVWDLVVNDKPQTKPTGLAARYFSLKEDYKRLEEDFTVVTKICELFLQLHNDYKGMAWISENGHVATAPSCNSTQDGGEERRDRRLQEGRLDVMIATRDETKTQQHTYMFRSKAEKESWLSSLRYAKLKLKQASPPTWIQMDADNDEDLYAVSKKMPLYVNSFSISMAINDMAVECAAKVGVQHAWFAGGDMANGWVSVVDCISPCPLVLENFSLPDSGLIMSILYVPPLRTSPSSQEGTILPPSHVPTVWMASLTHKIIIYDASTRKCLTSSTFPHMIVCMEFFRHQVYMATTDGNVVIFKRVEGNRWDLSKYTTVKVTPDTIQCMCIVENTLWVGVRNNVYFLKLHNLVVEGPVELGKEPELRVQKMLSIGSGVWVAWKDSTIELYHAQTVTPVQKIEVKRTIERMISSLQLDAKFQTLGRISITAMSEAFQRLWVGTSVGTILLYQLPQANGIPVVSGKPYMATRGHDDAVRVIVPVATVAGDTAYSRFSQFVSDEVQRYSAVDDDDGVSELNQAALDDLGSIPEVSVSDSEIAHQVGDTAASESSPPEPTYLNLSDISTCSGVPSQTSDPPADVGNAAEQVTRPPSTDSQDKTLKRVPSSNGRTTTVTSTSTSLSTSAMPTTSPSGTQRPSPSGTLHPSPSGTLTSPKATSCWYITDTFVRKDSIRRQKPSSSQETVHNNDGASSGGTGNEEKEGEGEAEKYIEPATLLREGLITTPELVVQPEGTIVRTMMKVPGHGNKASRQRGGPMYVLTAGRSNTHAQSAVSSTIKIKNGGVRVCVVAYEIEENQVD
eukprot:Em0008g789a